MRKTTTLKIKVKEPDSNIDLSQWLYKTIAQKLLEDQDFKEILYSKAEEKDASWEEHLSFSIYLLYNRINIINVMKRKD